MNLNKRFDGAVSITVVLKESEKKGEGWSPRLRVRAPVKPFSFLFFFLFLFYFIFFFFFLLLQGSRKFFAIYMFAEKTTCFDVLRTCKMARLVWRYSDDAGAIIENVYKFCMEEKKSGMKLSLNRVWDRTAALTGVSRFTAQKIVEEKKAQDEQQQPKQPPSSYVESVT